MIRLLRGAVLLAPVLVILSACGSSSGVSADLLAARETILVYPLAESRGTGNPPPGFYEVDHPKDFAADATYFVATPDIRDTILAFFKAELPKAGWTLEDPAVQSKDAQMAYFCSDATFALCGSFVRGDVRAIFALPITLSFNPAERLGSVYHIHLEHK